MKPPHIYLKLPLPIPLGCRWFGVLLSQSFFFNLTLFDLIIDFPDRGQVLRWFIPLEDLVIYRYWSLAFLEAGLDLWSNSRSWLSVFVVEALQFLVQTLVDLVMPPFTLWASVFTTFDEIFDFGLNLLRTFLPNCLSLRCLCS